MTLVEAVIAMVIVGVMLVAALSAVGSSARAKRSQSERCLGAHLARDLMAEALQASYHDPDGAAALGPDATEPHGVRRAWDDVDDYHGWSASPPQSSDGTALGWAEGWTREVAVEWVRPSDLAACGSDEGLKRITVTAVGPTGIKTTAVALRCDGSIYDQTPDVQTTYVTGVTATIEVGQDRPSRIVSGTQLLNPVEVSP
jgi:type II secretory pathway pseudopilin PulG